MIYTALYDSPLGKITMAADSYGLKGVWLENQKYFMKNLTDNTEINEDFSVLVDTKIWLNEYFSGKRDTDISKLPLFPDGSNFRKEIWKILCTIPYGQVLSYKEIAQIYSLLMGIKRMSAQAVGNAVGHNPISIIIPCHRVVGSKGNLTGYAGGLDKKIWLLKHEGVDTSKLFAP